MAGYLAQVTFQDLTGLPRDVSENVFHFTNDSDGTSAGDAEQIAQRLADFYIGVTGSAASIGSFLSGELEPIAQVKVYDVTAPPKTPPFYEDSFTGPWTGWPNLPPEVALCLSYYGTRNIVHQRGRIYLGPFGEAAILAAAPPYSQPSAGLIAAMAAGSARLLQNTGSIQQASTTKLPGTPATGPVKVFWSVFSKIGTGTKAAPVPGFTVLNNSWIDNEWDGQRRRRIAATMRTLSPNPPVTTP